MRSFVGFKKGNSKKPGGEKKYTNNTRIKRLSNLPRDISRVQLCAATTTTATIAFKSIIRGRNRGKVIYEWNKILEIVFLSAMQFL